MDNSVVSSDDDLEEFLKGLRQRYNLDAAPASSPTRVAAEAAAPSEAAGDVQLSEPSPKGPKGPVISTDAAILGLHPAFRGTLAQGVPSPSLKSGQPTSAAAAGEGTATTEAAAEGDAVQEPAAAAVASPAPQSESGSCTTPQQQRITASQLADAAAGQPATPTDITLVDADAGGVWRAAAPAGGVGAVAAAATPHSTAAMPAAWRQETQQGPVGQQQQVHGGVTHAQAVTLHEASSAAAEAAAGVHEAPAQSSASSSPGSISKPLLGAFTSAAGADAPASPGVAPAQQPPPQQADSESEVTFQSLLDSPRQRQQRRPPPQAESPPPQQQPHAPPAMAPGSPARPLLGAWAARAAAAVVGSGSPSFAHPAAGRAGSADLGAAEHAAASPEPVAAEAPEAHPADFVSDSAASPAPQQQQQQQQVEGAPALDWGRLSSQLSAAGFGHLACMQQGQEALPQLADLHDNLNKVLHEYQRRDSLMQQLLSERDEMRRSSRRSNTESSKLERERDEAVKTAAKLKTELSDVRSVEIPAMESRHKEAVGKLHSEVARLKHAVKEAEAVAAAAQAEVLAAGTQPTLQGQLHDAVRERERLRLECERLESELSRQKPLMKELEKSAAAARAASRQSADQAVLLDKQLRQLKQQHQEEQAVLTAELNKARHAAREAEQQLAAVRAEAAAGASEAPELLRQLSAERAQHDEQQAHMASELQGLRQQLLQLQQAAARAESAAKADSGAAAHAAKQLALQQKQHKTEVSQLSSEVQQARENLQLLQAKLIQAEAAAAEQAAAATGAEAAALESADRAAAAVVELDKVRTASKQQQQQLNEQLQDSKRAVAECQQQLASTQGELRRLRAAAGLAGAVSSGPAAAAGPTIPAGEVPDLEGGDLVAEGSSGSALGLEPAGPARAMRPGANADSSRSSSRAAAAAAAVASAAATVAAATATGDLAAALSRAVAAESAAADAEGVLIGLRYKCMQLEMACSRKEQELDALRDKMAQKVTREERRLARDKAVYQRIKQAYAASGGAAAGRRAAQAAAGGSNAWSATVEIGPGAGGAAARRSNAAGAVAAAARELRPVELVGIYEGQKEALEKELAAAKAEVRILSGQLRDAQNLLISKDRAAAVAAAAAGLKGSGLSAKLGDPAAAAAAQRKAAELQRELCTVRAEAASAVRDAAKRLAETEAEVSQLRGDVNALQEELDNRPTAAEQRRLQREIDLLQRKIAAVRRQVAAGQPGGAASAGEDALSAAVAAGDVWGADDRVGSSGRVRGTKTAIERDKALARLGLHAVEEFPRDVLVDIVQDMCIVLELGDATLLVPSLKKVAAVTAGIPSLQAFVTQVCEVVLRQGLAFMPDEVQDTGLKPQCVPKVLQQWLVLLRQGELLSQFVDQLQQLVAQRCGNGAAVMPVVMPPAGDTAQLQQFCQQLAQEVRALLQVESEAVAAADVLGAAKGLMVSQPDGLLQRLLGQVMDLLGVQQLEGLPATVNKVYVHYNELLNFLRAAVSLLGLPADAGPSTVMATLAKLVEQSAQPPSKVRQAAAELQAASSQQQSDSQPDWQQQQQQWEADSTGPRAAVAAAAAAAAAAADEHLSALLAVLGASSEQQAADRAREMVARLRRLDQVLPKYQSVVSQLYDRLRVVSLDELLPAFDRVMAQLSAAQRST